MIEFKYFVLIAIVGYLCGLFDGWRELGGKK